MKHPYIAQLDEIADKINRLRLSIKPAMPRPWAATHKHVRTGQFARELMRAMHMSEGNEIVVFEVLGAPTGFQRRAETAHDFDKHWLPLGRKAVA